MELRESHGTSFNALTVLSSTTVLTSRVGFPVAIVVVDLNIHKLFRVQSVGADGCGWREEWLR